MSFENLIARELERALPLQEGEGNWDEVLERAGFRRRRERRWVALAAFVIALGVAPAYALAPGVVGYFSNEGIDADLSQFSEEERRLIESLPSRAPRGEDTPALVSVQEVARNGERVYYRLDYADGTRCLARGKARAGQRLASIECGAPGEPPVVPTTGRPITVEVSVAISVVTGAGSQRLRISRVTGLAGSGITRVALVDDQGREVASEVTGNVYVLDDLPRRNFTEIVAYDRAGRALYRKQIAPSQDGQRARGT